MNIELAALESFLVLCQTRHFGQAAEQLHLSQPALSKQLQRLEQRLGGKLVERDTRSFELTTAGELLFEDGRELLKQAGILRQRVGLALDGKAGRLRIGFGIACLSSGLGDLLREFRLRYPEVQVSLQDMPSPAQLQALDEQTIDIGFIRYPVSRANLTAIPVFEERLVLAYPSRAEGSAAAWKLQNCAEKPFIALQPAVSSSFNDHFLRTCGAAGFAPRVVQYASELLTALHLVGAGIGVALVPHTASRMNVPDVSYAETGLSEAQWQIGITHRSDSQGPLMTNFLEMALSFAQARAFRE